MAIHQGAQHSIQSTNLADLLERVLDKGIVIAGDIKIKLVEVELLTLQIRLVICSVDKAKELGIDWWGNNPAFAPQSHREQMSSDEVSDLRQRLSSLEARLAKEEFSPDPTY